MTFKICTGINIKWIICIHPVLNLSKTVVSCQILIDELLNFEFMIEARWLINKYNSLAMKNVIML
jgi:hypothetical protein